MTTRFWLLTVTGFCAIFSARAQYSYRHYTLRDGLAQGSSYYIMQDSRRFLWMSVQGGLNRFDGSAFVFYPNGKKGLRGGFISGIVEAPGGDLWVGTEEGLNRYNRHTDSFTHLFPKGIAPAATHVFDADSTAVWYLNDVLGLVRYDYRTNRYTVLLPGIRTGPNFENDYVYHDPAAHLIWLLLPQGLMAYDYVRHRQRWYFTSRPDDPMHHPTAFTTMRWDAARQVFWLADATSILKFSPDNQSFIRFVSPVDLGTYPAYDIHIDARQQLWINTGGAGILVFDAHRQRFTEHLRHRPQNPQSLAIDEVGNLYIDREGTIWANVDPLGLDRIVADQAGIRTYTANAYEPGPLATNAIRGLAEAADGTIWIGSIGGGLSRLDPKTGSVRRYVATGKPGSLPGSSINGFCIDGRGHTYLATRQGLVRYVPETDQFRPCSLSPVADPQAAWVKGIFCEPTGSLLLATNAGLQRYRSENQSIESVGRDNARLVGSFWHDTLNHRLYVGRWQAGFDVYDYRNGQLHWLYNERLNGQNALWFYHESKQPTLWIGSSELIAYSVDEQQITKRIMLGDGIRPVYAILPDPSGIWWIPTNKGLYRYQPKTGQVRLLRSVSPQEYNSQAALISRSGTLYIGGNEGVVQIDPRKLTTRFNPITVALSSILINDHPTVLAANELDTVSLPANRRTLTVRYGAVDFVSEGKNQYQYRLHGYDPGWIDAGNSMVARYANLPPGTYTFEVKAANTDGQWTAQPRRLTVLVATPFWQATWFVLLMGVLGGAFLYGTFRWMLVRRLRAQRERYRLMLQSQQQERTRLARELHDHIGPDLAVLKLRMELAAEDAILPKQEQQLTDFSANLGHILTDIRNVSHALLPADLQAHSLVDSLDAFIRQLSLLPHQPEINFIHNLADNVPDLLRQPIYQMTKELIHNALKHADASMIDVELNGEPGNVQLTVSDDGRGYDPDTAHSQTDGIGLRNLQATVLMLNGELRIHPRPTRGTVHQVRLPA